MIRKASKFRWKTCASALVLSSLFSVSAYAQDSSQSETEASDDGTTQAVGSEPEGEGNAIVVTGSRLKRSNVEGPAPITVITTEDVRERGFSTVYDALLTTTEQLGDIEQDYTWGQSSPNAYPLNLRSLGPGRTLLLVNGHRVADYPMPYQGKSNFANFNNLPTGIIERTEILTGAASAIYGSDAMGGVVNVILKEDDDGHTGRFRYGGATRGGRKTWEAVLSGGFSGENWGLVYNLQHYNRGTLMAGQRPFMDDEADRPYAARNVLDRHFNVGRANPFPGLYLRDQDNPGPTGRTYIAPPAGACAQYNDLYFRAERVGYNRNTGVEANDGQYCAQRVFRYWALRTGSEDTSGYLHGNIDLGGVEAWASVGLWKTQGEFNTFLDAFVSRNYWDPRANNGAGGTRYFLKFMAPEELGGRESVLTITDETALDISAGLSGTLFDEKWDWDLMVGRATYKINESFPTLNQGQMRDFFMGQQMGTRNNVPIFTPDYDKLWNPLSPTQTAPFTDRGLKQADSWLNQAQLVFSGELFEGWAGPIQMAAVFEIGEQGYLLTPEPKTLNQDADGWSTPFGNIEQGGGKRRRYGAGLELSIPLLDMLTLTAAGRYDKYDAVASDAAFTYQGGLEFRPASNLLLRANYGTSFRAPDMHFVYAKPSERIADFTDYSACYAAGFPNNQCPRDDFLIDNATVARLGTPDLLYETGRSFSGGVVWDPFTGVSLSVDYWNIDIKNLIDDVNADQVLIDEGWCRYGKMPDGSTRNPPLSDTICALQSSRVQRNASGQVTRIETGPINRAQTRISGIDAKASYRLPDTPLGTFTFNAAFTQMLEFRSRQFPQDSFDNDVAKQVPRARFNANVAWSSGRWNAALYYYQKTGGRSARYDGCAPFADGYVPSASNNCRDVDSASPTFNQSTELVKAKRKPRRYINGSLGYQITDWIKLNLYASNILDKIYGDEYCGDFAFCIDDPVGRQVAAEVVVKF